MSNGKPEFHIRTALPSDTAQILEISASATRKFATITELSDLAEDREEEVQVQKWLDQGRIYLAESTKKSVGFIAAHPMDDAIYIDEVSVEEGHQGKGIGGMILDAVKRWALERRTQAGSDSARVSLKTYADVPWNGVWYRKHGFKEVDPSVIGLAHVELAVDDKAKLERPGYRRCCMLWESSPT